MELTLYDDPISGNGYKARLLLAQLDIPYRLVERDILKQETPTAAFLQQPAEALFDVQADPEEAVNLIDDPAMQEVAQQMRTKVRRFRMATSDPWVLASRQMGEDGLTGGVS